MTFAFDGVVISFNRKVNVAWEHVFVFVYAILKSVKVDDTPNGRSPRKD